MFISVKGWSANVPQLLKQNRFKRIILVDGEDIRGVLAGNIKLAEMLRSKIEVLNLYTEPFRSVEDILSSEST